jgi:hypothetical protein
MTLGKYLVVLTFEKIYITDVAYLMLYFTYSLYKYIIHLKYDSLHSPTSNKLTIPWNKSPPWEISTHSWAEEIPNLLWNPKVHCSTLTCQSLVIISMYSSKTVDKKEILCTVSNSGIYCSSDKVGTVYLV